MHPDHPRLLAGLLCCLLPVVLPAQPRPAPVSRDVLQLDPMKVSGAGVSASEAAGTEPTEVYDEQDLAESGIFDLDEFFAQLPPSPAGDEQLVYIDGEPSPRPLSSIPPEMIASIEVSNHGALPQYGAYANGRVVNIRLKTNYRGEILAWQGGGSFQGDGLRGRVWFNSEVKRGKLSLGYTIAYREQQALMASARSFSRNQDHTARGGTDLRLLWGDKAVVRAVTGNLVGVVDATGQPTSVALAPATGDGRGLSAGDFLPAQIFPPATVATAAGQRRFNTADYLTLVTPSNDLTASFHLSRPVGARIQAGITASVTRRGATRSLAPPVSGASGTTVVPAAYNPFGQDVQIGLVHAGFGPVSQDDESTSAQLGLNLNGRLADTWRWGAVLGGRWSDAKQTVADLDRDALAGALAAADPAQRFNPFGEDPQNEKLYRELTLIRSSATENLSMRLDLNARGEVVPLPGGPMRLMLRGNHHGQRRTRTYVNPAGADTADSRRGDSSQSVSATLAFPWVGQANARPWVRRLEHNLSADYSSRSGLPGGTVNGRIGASWSPHRALSFSGNYSASRLAPSRFLADARSLAGETFIDPRRSPATSTEVAVIERDFEGSVRAQGGQLRLSASVEPPFVAGLQLTATFSRRDQEDLTSSSFQAQDLIYNELTFPGRVVRAAPGEDDLRLGQPGRILSVDTTPTDQALRESRDLDWSLRYRRRSPRFGQIDVRASVRQALSRRYEVAPGVPFVFESGNDLNPPDWRLQGRLAWSRSGWRVSTDVRLVDEVRSGTFIQPATRRFRLELGYHFSKPVWGRWGKGLRVELELDNLTTGTPPLADTINGFRTGSALGRTWSISMRMPLQPAASSRTPAGDDGEG